MLICEARLDTKEIKNMSDPMTTSELSQDDKNMALIAAVVGIFTILGPLIIFLIKKDQSQYVGFHALQSTIISALHIVWLIPVANIFLGPIALIVNLVFQIQAAMAINRGAWYEAPVVGKFVKQQLKMA